MRPAETEDDLRATILASADDARLVLVIVGSAPKVDHCEIQTDSDAATHNFTIPMQNTYT